MNWKFLLVFLAITVVVCDAWWGRRRRRRRPPPPPKPTLSPHCKNLVNRYSKIQGNNLHDLVRAWAPAVKLARGETWNPSSVDFFLQHVRLDGMHFNGPLTSRNLPSCNRGCFLVSKQHINCASCTNLNWFHGETSGRVPVYVFIHNNGKVVEFDYRFFFPYNRGKSACVGVKLNNACLCPKTPWGCSCPRVTKCLGKYSTFGHHVGDWENIKIRFENNRLRSMYVSTHNNAITEANVGTFVWNGVKFTKGNKAVEMQACTHGIVYSSKGSHGFWNTPGNHVYKRLKNGEHLVDECSHGQSWDTWHNLKITNYQNNRANYRGEMTFARFLGRWGNREDGCKLSKKFLGVCIREDGPHLSI